MIKNLLQIIDVNIRKESIKITSKTNLWCVLPYPNHKGGCPNYNKNELCPPNTKLLNLKKYSQFKLIYVIFDFNSYKEWRKEQNPQWSDKQISCVLYWQGSVKKYLKEYIIKNMNGNPYILGCGSGFKINGKEYPSMEAVGIDVFTTLKNNDIDFEIKPINKIVMCCLLCYRNNGLDNWLKKDTARSSVEV